MPVSDAYKLTVSTRSLSYARPGSSSAREVAYLVDDDLQARNEVSTFFKAAHIEVIDFGSAGEYLDFPESGNAACVITSLHLPDMSGLELQRRLRSKASPPVIFISAQYDNAATVCAMKAGAVDFLIKPVPLTALLEAARAAFAQDRQMRQQKAELAGLEDRFSTLTRREREVLPLIVGGLLNKQAASVLGISEITLQVHRGQVMRKMKAPCFADLVRMAAKLGIGLEDCPINDQPRSRALDK